MKYSRRDSDRVFSSINHAWHTIANGTHIQFVSEGKIVHGKVVGRSMGLERRLSVVDDFGKHHRFCDLSRISVYSADMGGYIPAVTFGSL